MNAHVDASYNRQRLFYMFMLNEFGEEYKKDYEDFYNQKYLKNETYKKLFGNNNNQETIENVNELAK